MRLWLLGVLVLAACDRSVQQDAPGDVRLDSAGHGAATRVAAPAPPDTAVVAAQRALDAGHPWQATRLLAPVLRDATQRTPEVVLLAARAAAGWEGWSEVDRLLRAESWVSNQFGGRGLELLARSSLERGADTLAATYAEAAVRIASDAATRARRLVYLGRALDRLNQRDSARAAYAAAAGQLREVSDWLLLRAAGVADDSTERERLFVDVRRAVARERIAWTDALARERAGDLAGAATRYAQLGAMPSALRLRIALAADSAAREALRDSVVAFIRARSGSADARLAVEVLDRAYPTLSPSEELVVARSANLSGPASRALAGYQRGITAPDAQPADRLAFGEALIRAGRYREAIAQLQQLREPSNLAAQAAYQRARALLLSGDRNGARNALRAAANSYRGDTAGASASLFLLGDLATDDGRDADALAAFRELYRVYPSSPRADDARFRAAMITLLRGDERSAARQFDSLVAVRPSSNEATAARYWGGRAYAAAGDRPRAQQHWRDVIAHAPLSYYAGRSAQRLGVSPWSVPGGLGPDQFPNVPAVDSAMRRISALEQLGMDAEARFEYDALETAAGTSVERLLATAAALRAHGQTTRAIKLAWKLVDRGQREARVYRLAYPVIDQGELVRQSRARSVDPVLVAAIIRQESAFNPRAVSVAGARGLMQVLPPVGQQIARSLGYPVWDPVLLFEPDANLELGVAHLAAALRQYDNLTRVLAAYNAGGSRVKRWDDKKGVDDPEVFTERIPFVETRDYVRIVQRNVEIYRALYAW